MVKNVAGYDLGKLMSGSFGAFAVIVDATFKLSPQPQASTTIVVDHADPAALGRDAAALGDSQVEPVMSEVLASFGPGSSASHRLAVCFATSPAATAAQADAASAILGGRGERIGGEREAALWQAHAAAPWPSPGLIVRAAWLPAALPQVLALLRDTQQRTGTTIELAGRTAVGAGFIRVDGSEDGMVAAVEGLRRRSDAVGHVVLLRAPTSVERRVDVWGEANAAAAVHRRRQARLRSGGHPERRPRPGVATVRP